jgi:hypothetical protein
VERERVEKQQQQQHEANEAQEAKVKDKRERESQQEAQRKLVIEILSDSDDEAVEDEALRIVYKDAAKKSSDLPANWEANDAEKHVQLFDVPKSSAEYTEVYGILEREVDEIKKKPNPVLQGREVVAFFHFCAVPFASGYMLPRTSQDYLQCSSAQVHRNPSGRSYCFLTQTAPKSSIYRYYIYTTVNHR